MDTSGGLRKQTKRKDEVSVGLTTEISELYEGLEMKMNGGDKREAQTT
jgi:hypothetical protein